MSSGTPHIFKKVGFMPNSLLYDNLVIYDLISIHLENSLQALCIEEKRTVAA